MRNKLEGQTVTELENGLTNIKGTCRFIGIDHEVVVPSEGLKQWLSGMAIQRAMPNVSLDDREFLISGVSPRGWEEKFGK